MITFTCKAYENITYLDEIGKSLLSLMGHSGTIPGALKAEEVSKALSSLQSGLGRENTTGSAQASEEGETSISLRKRAIPLIGLLEAAIKKQCDVLWS